MSRTTGCELMNICMVYDVLGDRVLVQHRVNGWRGAAFPGGHVERGESLVDSVCREVWEETGLTVERPRLMGVVDWERSEDGERSLIFCYRAESFHGSLRPESAEGRNEWVSMEDFQSLKLAPWLEQQLCVFFNESANEVYYRYSDLIAEQEEGHIQEVRWQ